MILNTVVAQSIAEIARSLGLPANQSANLVAAMTAIEFNNTNLTLAEEIWRDAQLDHNDLSFSTNTEAIRWVDQVVIPGMSSYVDSKITVVTAPSFSFPLSVEIISQAFPNLSYISVTNIVVGWERCRLLIIKYFCLAEIFLKADNTSEEYLKKSAEFRRLGEDTLTSLILSLRGTIDVIPIDMGGGTGSAIKTLVIKLRKNKRTFDSEYGSYN